MKVVQEEVCPYMSPSESAERQTDLALIRFSDLYSLSAGSRPKRRCSSSPTIRLTASELPASLAMLSRL